MLDFPSNPTTNQIFTAGNSSWTWDGTKWTPTPTGAGNPPPAPSNSTPLMDGTAVAGTSLLYTRGDHVHPTDSSRYAVTNPAGYQTAAQVTTSLGSYMPLAGGVLTGNSGVTTTGSSAFVLTSPIGSQNILAGNRPGSPVTARWTVVLGDATPETGGNAGSDFEIYRYSDTGGVLDSPLHITRSNGAVYVTDRFNVQNSALDVSGGATTIANLTVGSGGLATSGAVNFNGVSNISNLTVGSGGLWSSGQTDLFSSNLHGSMSLTGGSNLIPTNNACSCGYGGQAWQQVMSYAFPNASDPRDKKHVHPSSAGALDEVNRIQVVRYRWNSDPDDAPMHTGFLATDVLDVLGSDRAAVLVGDDEDSSLAINLMDMIATLWQAVQELSDRKGA